MKKRYVLEAIGIAAVLLIVVVAGQAFRGYLITKSYVPEIAQEYESIDYVQTEVSFGYVLRLDWWNWIASVLLLLIWIVCYGKVRIWLSRRLGNQVDRR